MRILTHNMLCCLKCDHFPLTIKAKEKVEDQQEEDLKFVIHMLPKIDYDALKLAAKDVCNINKLFKDIFLNVSK